ncbi:MAG: hypothetical protein Q9217_002236 [Psora testacea]
MAEYIGSRISLISKRDIRYVGTLHEISSENSTVALEQVVSYGTEGRSEEEVPASDNVYEYIVFRGSDVKDLRIEKEPEKKREEVKVPDDPAILGNARPGGVPSAIPQRQQQSPPQEPSSQQQQQQQQQLQQEKQQQQPSFNQHQGRGHPPRFPQHSPFAYGGYRPPPNQRFGPYGGPQGFPPHGYPGMPYGPPPGWYPPPGQGFPQGHPGQIYPPHMQQGFPAPPPNQQAPPSKPSTPAEQTLNVAQIPFQQPAAIEKPAATVKLPSSSTTPAPQVVQNGPPPPTESKPDIAAALAPPASSAAKDTPAERPAPAASKSGRIMPAIPMISPSMKPKMTVNGASESYAATISTAQAPTMTQAVAPHPTQAPTKSREDHNRDARAAVAAAMAKLPPMTGQPKKQANGESAIDNLTNKVNEMRTYDNARTSRQPGTGGYAPGHRVGRGGYRGGRPRTESQTKKIEVPKTDYDFAEANAKFNKQDLVKEAIASGDTVSSPIKGSNGTPEASTVGLRRESEQNISLPTAAGYNKTSSFFDNISSESKDREDASNKKLGGREFRNEEQKKNFETFGQGSVDNYRGGYRGRGRGRGLRGGRGYSRGGRGGYGYRINSIAHGYLQTQGTDSNLHPPTRLQGSHNFLFVYIAPQSSNPPISIAARSAFSALPFDKGTRDISGRKLARIDQVNNGSMTDLLHTLPSFPTKLYTHLLPSLEKNLITTADLLTLDSLEVAKRAQLPPLDVKRLIAHVLESLRGELGVKSIGQDEESGKKFEDIPTEGVEGWGVLKCGGRELGERRWETINSGDAKLDQVFGGGIPIGYITEIVGESGAGKTQLILYFLLLAQLGLPYGLGRPTLYISTEHPLPTTRLTQLLHSNPLFSSLPSANRPTLAKILSIQTPDLESQDHILNYQLPVALQRHNIGLVVIDSIAANYRAEKGSGENAAALASRSAQLIKLGALLQNLAREHKCAIVVANQVGDRFSSFPTYPATGMGRRPPGINSMQQRPNHFSSLPTPAATPGAKNNAAATAPLSPVLSLDHQQRFFTGWGDSPYPHDSENLKTPTLGLTWANQIACRIALVKVPAFTRSFGGPSREGAVVGSRAAEEASLESGGEWAPRRWRRWMRMVYAPWAEPTEEGQKGVEFEVWAGGVRAINARGNEAEAEA